MEWKEARPARWLSTAPPLSALKISQKLLVIVCLTVLEVSITVWATFQVSKGAQLHQLNSLHLKHNAAFSRLVHQAGSGGDVSTENLRDAVLAIRDQPIAGKELIGAEGKLAFFADRAAVCVDGDDGDEVFVFAVVAEGFADEVAILKKDAELMIAESNYIAAIQGLPLAEAQRKPQVSLRAGGEVRETDNSVTGDRSSDRVGYSVNLSQTIYNKNHNVTPKVQSQW